jgi:arginine/lysine/ornithine decarboxylase
MDKLLDQNLEGILNQQHLMMQSPLFLLIANASYIGKVYICNDLQKVLKTLLDSIHVDTYYRIKLCVYKKSMLANKNFMYIMCVNHVRLFQA